MIKLRNYLFLFVIAASFAASNALFFHVPFTGKRCFFQEIPDNTMVTGRYKAELERYLEQEQVFALASTEMQNTSASLFGLVVEVKDAAGSLVMSKMFGLEGRFTFISYDSGDHQICLAPNGTSANPFGYLRIHLDIKIGGDAVDYEVVRKKEKLNEMQFRIRQLLDHTDQIKKEQNYQRSREVRFRKLSESIDKQIFWFYILQTFILTTAGFVQVLHLKEFFRRKKLV